VNGKIIYIGAFVLAFLLVTGGVYYLNTKYNNIFAFDFSPANQPPEKKKDGAKKKTEKKSDKKNDKKEAPNEQKEENKEEPKKNEEAPKPNQEQVAQQEVSITPTFLPTEPSKSNLKPLGEDNSKNGKKDNKQVSAPNNKALLDSINHLNKKLKEMIASRDVKNDPKKSKTKTKAEIQAAIQDSIKQYELANTIQRRDSTYKSWLKKTVALYEAMDSKKVAKIILTYSDNIAKDIVYAMKKKKAAEILSQLTPETVNRITRVK